MEDQKTSYIATYIFPQMDGEELSGAHSRLIKFLEGAGAHILHSRMPVLRQFAYPIQKKTGGFMGEVEFWADSSSIPEMSKAMKSIGNLMRFIIVKKERPEKKIFKRVMSANRPIIKESGEGARGRESGREKIGLEDIDKRLDEIMENVGDS